MLMTGDDIETFGLALFGANWRKILAFRLQRSTKTISRWRSGESPLPDAIETELHSLIMEQKAALDRLEARVS